MFCCFWDQMLPLVSGVYCVSKFVIRSVLYNLQYIHCIQYVCIVVVLNYCVGTKQEAADGEELRVLEVLCLLVWYIVSIIFFPSQNNDIGCSYDLVQVWRYTCVVVYTTGMRTYQYWESFSNADVYQDFWQS